MSKETTDKVVHLTPEISQEMITECMKEQDEGIGPVMTEHKEKIVKLDIDILKYFIYETMKGRRVTMLLEHPGLYPLLQS